VELFHQGERASAIFLVVGGCLILRETLRDGTGRVTGFRLAGEIAGIEGWGRGTHGHTAEAATPTYVCRLSRSSRVAELSGGWLLERLLLKCASQLDRAARPWARLPAVERVAAFIEDYAERVQVKGAAGAHFTLPMTRADIGSYLGLAEETVVRALGELCRARRLTVRGRTVNITASPGA
jgi:CRP/FNR family transcriptional regulator